MALPERSGAVDKFRFIAAFLIIAIHTSPLSSINDTADFILTRIIARVAVPFFFMATGYFLFSYMHNGKRHYLSKFCKKTSILYGLSILLYLPLNIYNHYFEQPARWPRWIKDILVEGTLYHLWYLPAVLAGVILVALLVYKAGIRKTVIFSVALYVIGLFGDSYYGLSQLIPFLKPFYDGFFLLFDYTRNGLFFAPVFLAMGGLIFSNQKKLSMKKNIIGLALSTAFLIVEGLLLHHLRLQRHDSMYVMLLPCMYFLFLLLLRMDGSGSKYLRTISMLIYIIHPWMIVFVRGLAKVTQLQTLLIDNSMVHYAAVSILSLGSAAFLNFLWSNFRKPTPTMKNRAWVEINLAALKHNVKVIQKALPEHCKLMAVVKANAYGHGDVAIAKTLNQSGIYAFAVATLDEGIHLRKSGINGEILILGYTNPCDIACLVRYHLTQTVIDHAYAQALNARRKKVKVHLKVDTGMHRLGIEHTNLSEMESIYQCKYLEVSGIFSHLCVSDSLSDEAVSYTNIQIKRFDDVITFLKHKGYEPGKLHIQSSYGILNYPRLSFDYARAGILLYGVLSHKNQTRIHLDLQPVLALKARIGSAKQIASGESVSYGKQFTAKNEMSIATVTIGYADGVPKNYSGENAYVLLHGKKAAIIGSICMDQLIIDITHIDEVQPNDTVTLIGIDGNEQIYCEDIAKKCGTITNEVLSRLGCRLSRFITRED